jgi:hypothetical protein
VFASRIQVQAVTRLTWKRRAIAGARHPERMSNTAAMRSPAQAPGNSAAWRKRAPGVTSDRVIVSGFFMEAEHCTDPRIRKVI